MECVYTRSGIIRRVRKRKRKRLDALESNNDSSEVRRSVVSSSLSARASESNTVQSHLTDDIETTRGLLRNLGASHDTSLGALTSLSEACAAVWHNAMEFGSQSKGYFLFEDRAAFWVESGINADAHESISTS